MFNQEGIVEKSLESLATFQGTNPMGILVVIVLSGLVLLLFAFGTMIYLKFRKELKKITHNGNGPNGEMKQMGIKIDKLFSLVSMLKADVNYLKGKMDAMTQQDKRD